MYVQIVNPFGNKVLGRASKGSTTVAAAEGFIDQNEIISVS